MAEVVYKGVTQTGPIQYQVSWVAGAEGTLYRVWIDGVLHGTTYNTYYDVTVDVGDSPRISVFDSAADRPTKAYPANVTLQWYHSDRAVKYRVRKWVSGAWVQLEEITRRGEYMFEWRSPRLEDGEAYLFSVIPLIEDETEGEATEFSGVMVRTPDAPSATFTVDSVTTFVTVS